MDQAKRSTASVLFKRLWHWFQYRRDRWMLLGLAAVLMCACSSEAFPDRADLAAMPSNEFRTVHHVLGETRVPVHPQRILALTGTTDLDTLLALGITPMAAGVDASYYRDNGFFSHFQGRTAGIQPIPAWPQFNLEQILQLKPDLILGQRNYVEPVYAQLSQIAPTFVYENVVRDSANWRSTVREIAVAMGQSKKGEQVLQRLEQRLVDVRTSLREKLNETEVSVVFYWTAERSFYSISGKKSFGGSLLQELGLRRPPAQRFEDASQNMSLELASYADADIIFFLNYNEPEQIERLIKHPLWKQLKAVQNDQVYSVENIRWHMPGVLAAHAVLDDIEQYVLRQPPSPKSN